MLAGGERGRHEDWNMRLRLGGSKGQEDPFKGDGWRREAIIDNVADAG